MSDSVRPYGQQPTKLLLPWGSLGKNTGVGCYFLVQGIFPSQYLNTCLLHCSWILYHSPTWKALWSLSVQFSCSVMSNSLRPHESQHARPPCLSPSPRVHSDSHPSSPWCHPAISSWVVPFSCAQSLPASESFPMSQLFTWGGQSTGVSALASYDPEILLLGL